MINRKYLKNILSDFEAKIRFFSNFVKVREIDDLIIVSTNYITVNFNISKTLKDKSTIVKFFRKLHNVDNLSTKILIDVNIIESRKMTKSAFKLKSNFCQDILIDL